MEEGKVEEWVRLKGSREVGGKKTGNYCVMEVKREEF